MAKFGWQTTVDGRLSLLGSITSDPGPKLGQVLNGVSVAFTVLRDRKLGNSTKSRRGEVTCLSLLGSVRSRNFTKSRWRETCLSPLDCAVTSTKFGQVQDSRRGYTFHLWIASRRLRTRVLDRVWAGDLWDCITRDFPKSQRGESCYSTCDAIKYKTSRGAWGCASCDLRCGAQSSGC